MPVSSHPAEEGGVPAVHELGWGGVVHSIPRLPHAYTRGPGTVDDLVPVL
jgi:hypothetical protein